jgi:hypothetical protein
MGHGRGKNTQLPFVGSQLGDAADENQFHNVFVASEVSGFG